MSEFPTTMSNRTHMAEITRLMKAGRIQEATALIQRGLAKHDPNRRNNAGSRQDDAHASVLPETLRDALGHVVGGLRGIAPGLSGLWGKDIHDREPGGAEADDDRFVTRHFSNAAGSRDYKLFIPSDRNGKRPLLVMLHGCTQSPDDFAAGTQMNVAAEEEGFYVAYPQQTRGANAQKCWNWFEPQHQGRESGEAGVIAGIARAVMAEHAIDPKRVYIAGLSAGGAAAANIARAYPDLFAAVGVHSGLAAGCARDLSSALMAMNAGAPGAATPGGSTAFGAATAHTAIRIPTIVFHGDADSTVNPRNGEEVLAQAGIADLTPVREAAGNATGQPHTRTRYKDATGHVQVESWIVRGAGHAWSGGSAKGSYTNPAGPDASRAMVAFFKENALAQPLA